MRTVRTDKRTCRNLCRFRRQYTTTSSAASAATTGTRWGTKGDGSEHDECKKDHQGASNADASDEEPMSRARVLPQGQGRGTNRRISRRISALGTKRRIIRQFDGAMCTVHVGMKLRIGNALSPIITDSQQNRNRKIVQKTTKFWWGSANRRQISQKFPIFLHFFR